MSDENGLITYINQTWIDWTGKPYEEHLGFKWAESIIDDDRATATAKFLTDLAKRVLYEAEFRIDHVDGTKHWCVATGRPQYGNDNKFLGYIGACVDITEQKYLQQQNMVASATNKPDHQFCVSDFTTSFQKTTNIFYGEAVKLTHVPIWG